MYLQTSPVRVKNLMNSAGTIRNKGSVVVAGSDLVGGGDAPKVRDVGDGPHREAAVHETVVDEHVRHPEQRDPEPLRRPNTGMRMRHVTT
jgi:hypothetical protein